MKKTLAAVAIMGAFAGSAMADVTVYGRLDTGLMFNQTKYTDSGSTFDITKDGWSMESGNYSSSRLGFKGVEKIGDDLTVGFVLETGIKSDTGLGFDGGFNREAQLSVTGKYGTLAVGRMGTIMSDSGSYGFAAAAMSPIGSGAVNFLGTGLFAGAQVEGDARFYNMITYQTPVMGGVQVSAQFGTSENENEFESYNDRYAALGVNYQAGALQMVAVAEYVNEDSETGEQDDMTTFNVGGNYDFGVAKVYAGAQYFKNADDAAGMIDILKTSKFEFAKAKYGQYYDDETIKGWMTDETDDAKGYSVTLGVSAPVMGGTACLGATYLDGEATISEDTSGPAKHDIKVWNVGASYEYPLSKQTYLYGIGGFTKYEAESVKGSGTVETFAAAVGIVHSF